MLDESTDVSNCSYFFVYCRYIHAVELKEEFLMCKILETTSKVTDDQEEMNHLYQQDELVELRWLAMGAIKHIGFDPGGALSMLSVVRLCNSGEQTGTAHHFYSLCSSTTCPNKLSTSRILENSFETRN